MLKSRVRDTSRNAGMGGEPNHAQFTLRSLAALAAILPVAFGAMRVWMPLGIFLVVVVVAAFLASVRGSGRIAFLIHALVTVLAIVGSLIFFAMLADFV